MFFRLIGLVACCLLSGCAALAPASALISPSLGGGAGAQVNSLTSVYLDRDNFVLVKTNVFGLSKGFKLFGIITIVPATLTKAMSRMYDSAQMRLGEPQTVAHSIVEQSSSYWILFAIPKVEMHADIIQFRPAVTTEERARHPKVRGKPPDQRQGR